MNEQPSDTQKYAYTYDLAGSRLTEATPAGGTTWVANDVNQVETQTPNGGSATAFGYDDDGNLLWDGVRSYEWDGENRLTAVEVTGSYRSEFSYDGAGHRIRILDLDGQGATVADHYYIWCGDTICEERASDQTTVTKRNFPWGVEDNGDPYYYTRDHLGSVRDITNAVGTVVGSLDYDPYGRMTPAQGSMVPDFGYAGYFYHAASGLNLTMYRAYDPRLGRWLSRDPIGEAGGLNLYGYVRGNPTNRIDPYGLWDVFGFGSLTTETVGPVRLAGEAVGLGGYSSDSGWYLGDLFAGGYEVGGHENYFGSFEGAETTTSCASPKKITLKEFSWGAEIPWIGGGGVGVGYYSTDEESGFFAFAGGGVLGAHASLGAGWSPW